MPAGRRSTAPVWPPKTAQPGPGHMGETLFCHTHVVSQKKCAGSRWAGPGEWLADSGRQTAIASLRTACLPCRESLRILYASGLVALFVSSWFQVRATRSMRPPCRVFIPPLLRISGIRLSRTGIWSADRAPRRARRARTRKIVRLFGRFMEKGEEGMGAGRRKTEDPLDRGAIHDNGHIRTSCVLPRHPAMNDGPW